MKPFQLSCEQIVKKYKTDEVKGLTEKEAQKRLVQYGPNTLPEKPPKSWLIIFLRQFQNPLIYILLLAAIIIFLVGPEKLDAFIISFILLFNAFIGTIQEGRTRHILDSLKKFVSVEAVVVRNGEKLVIDACNLVPGDIVLLQEGQRVPADMRLLNVNNMRIDEALLTGEAIGVSKDAYAEFEAAAPLADQRNMVFKGTYVLAGFGKGVVVATGRDTEIGKIQRIAEDIQTDMPLKQELMRVSHWILFGVLVICIILFIFGIITGKPLKELLVTITALFICVVPEGLPVVLTLVLVSGVYRMAKQRVLVKRMQAVEALGRTDVIVIDKTGTLTRNEMMVSEIFADDALWQVTGEGYNSAGSLLCDGKKISHFDPKSPVFEMATAGMLLNNAEVTYLPDDRLYAVKGDPTEAALAVFAQKVGLSRDQLEQKFQKIYEIPFDSWEKYHAGFYHHNQHIIAWVIGAPEALFPRAKSVELSIENGLSDLLAKGLRVVAIACKHIELPEIDTIEKDEQFRQLLENDLEILGLCGIQDAIRTEVKEVIEQTRAAGIKVIMATGDHKRTALYVAQRVGIFKPGDSVVNGLDLEKLSENVWQKRLDTVTVYARVSPEHKLLIIKQFHNRGDIVAMTGDGVNDVPSLLAADIGIAMGRIGTEVAKEAADIVLLDDSFVHVVSAIEQGRHIFYTLRRVVLYFFATNTGEVLIMLFALVVYFIHPTYPLPLTAAQILWLNLITDGFLDTALSMEQKENGLLTQKWLKETRHLVDKPLILKALFMAIPMAIGSLAVYTPWHDDNLAYARTMALVTMAMFQWFNAWNCRSEKLSIMQLGLFSNGWLVLATIFVLGLQIALVYTPWLQTIFKTVPISLADWALIITVSSSVLILEELRKWIARVKNG